MSARGEGNFIEMCVHTSTCYNVLYSTWSAPRERMGWMGMSTADIRVEYTRDRGSHKLELEGKTIQLEEMLLSDCDTSTNHIEVSYFGFWILDLRRV